MDTMYSASNDSSHKNGHYLVLQVPTIKKKASAEIMDYFHLLVPYVHARKKVLVPYLE